MSLTPEVDIESPPEEFVLGYLNPAEADLEVSSIRLFLKLVRSLGLLVKVTATRSYTGPVYYKSKSRTHNKGDVWKPGFERECVFVTATNGFDFAVQAAWYGGQFESAMVGGKRSGHRPAAMFTQITKLTQEVKRCLA